MRSSRVVGVVVSFVIAVSTLAVASPASADPDPAVPPVGAPLGDEEAAAQQAAATGVPVVIDSLTTETQLISALPDGSRRLEASAVPQRIESAAGLWVPVDTTLSPAAGWIAPAATSVPVKFSAGGSGPLAMAQADGGQWPSVDWPVGDLPTPVVNGSTARYPAVFPGVDLVLTAQVSGFSQVLVIASAAAAANPDLQAVTFGFSAPALGSADAPADAVSLIDDQGKVALQIGTPVYWDSSTAGSSTAGPGGGGMPDSLPASTTGVGSDDAVSVTIDASIGTDATPADPITYPLFVDPEVVRGALSWLYVDSVHPTTNYLNGASTDGYAHVGHIAAQYDDEGQNRTTRSYWAMDVAALRGKHVINAVFRTQIAYSASCDAKNIRLLESGPPSSSSTWNNQPVAGALNDTKAVVGGGRPGTACAAQPLTGWSATTAVRRNAVGNSSVVGLLLAATDESDGLAWRKFTASAVLIVEYNSYPSTPAGRSLSPCLFDCGTVTYTNAKRPEYHAYSSDADSGQTRKYQFEVYAGHAANPSTLVNATTTAYYGNGQYAVYTSNEDRADGPYQWRVRAYDGIDYGPWSSLLKFVVDTVAPATPTVTVLSGAGYVGGPGRTGVVGTPATLQLTSPPGEAFVEYVYGFSSPIPVQPAGNPYPCPSQTGGFTVVCAPSPGATTTVTVAPINLDTPFYIQGYDRAGNVSTNNPALSKTLLVYGDTAAADARHAWPDPPGAGTSIPDRPTAASPTPLMPTAGLTWVPDTPSPLVGSTQVMRFNGTASASASSYVVPTASGSLTMGVWMKPSAAGSGFRPALSQQGSSRSAFRLDLSPGNLVRLCVPKTQASTFDGACASSAEPVEDDEWIFVTGVIDRVNKQLRIYINDAGDPVGTAPFISSTPSTGAFSVGTSPDPTTTNWVGSLYNPFIFQGVADPTMIGQLMKNQY